MASWDAARLFPLVLGILLNVSEAASTSEELSRSPALGEIAELGQLFDANNGHFRPVNVFKTKELPSEAIRVLNVSKATVDTTTSSTFKNRLKLLNINGNTAGNILSGLVEPEGGSAFLQDTHSSRMEVSGTLLFKYQTVQENLQIFNEELNALYTKDVLLHKFATHVLTGIKWGANVALTLQGKASSTENRQDLNSALENEIKMLKSAEAVSSKSKSNFSLSFKADIALPILQPTSHGQVKEMLGQIPLIIQGTEGGKGAPIEFTFTPLGLIREHNQITEAPTMSYQIDEWILQKFVDIYDDISSVGQQVNDLNSLISSNTICLTSETKANMSQLLSDFETSKLTFTDEFNTKLVNVRSGQLQPTALSNLVQGYNENKFNTKNVQTELAQFDIAREKINLYNVLRDANLPIEYFGSNTDFTTRVQENLGSVIYVLFQSPGFTQNNPEAFKSSLKTFLTTLSKPFNKQFVVDCDFSHPECSTMNKTTLKQIKNGQFIVHDVNFEIKNATVAEPLKIKAIGRFAQIGELFDIRTDKFIGRSILNSKKSQENILKTLTAPSSETIIVPSGRYHDKFKALTIAPEQQFSILAEVGLLTRSGLYFDRTEDNNGIVSIVSIRRLSEVELEMNDPVFISSLDINVAIRPSATHFVSKIEYGFYTIFSIQVNETITTNAKEVADYLRNLKTTISQFNLKTNMNDPNATTQLVSTQKLPELPSDWKIKIFSDTQSIEEKPTVIETSEDLFTYLNSIFVQQQSVQNSGQGQPIAYIMEPIQNLRTKGVLGESVSFGLVSSGGETPVAIEIIIDDVNTARHQIKELSEEQKENADCITDHDAQVLKEIETNFESTLGSLMTRFKRVVKEIKSGKTGADELTRLRQDFRNKTYFNSRELRRLALVEQKLYFYKQIKRSNIIYLGRKDSSPYFSFVLDTNEKTFRHYLLYYKPEWTQEKEDIWHRVSHVFFNTLANGKESGSNSRLYLVDCDFWHPKCEGMTQPAIYAYREGNLTTADFLLEVQKDEKEWQKLNEEMKTKFQAIDSKTTQLADKIVAVESRVTKNENDVGRVTGDIATVKVELTKNKNDICVLQTELYTVNVTAIQNKNHAPRVTDTIAAVESKVTKNENDIEELMTRLDTVNGTTIGNQNHIYKFAAVIAEVTQNKDDIESKIRLYTGVRHTGRDTYRNLYGNRCVSLEHSVGYSEGYKSLDTSGTCVRICSRTDCTGTCHVMVPGTKGHWNLEEIQMSNRVNSIQAC